MNPSEQQARAELARILGTLIRCYRAEERAQKELGDALRRWRKHARIKQVALSGRLFGTVARSTDICGVENGRIDASRGLVRLLAQYLEREEAKP